LASPTWENSPIIYCPMFDDGFGEVGDKNSKVVSFSKFWGCIFLRFKIYSYT